jgi:hypothetical protein
VTGEALLALLTVGPTVRQHGGSVFFQRAFCALWAFSRSQQSISLVSQRRFRPKLNPFGSPPDDMSRYNIGREQRNFVASSFVFSTCSPRVESDKADPPFPKATKKKHLLKVSYLKKRVGNSSGRRNSNFS